ncbi:MAG: EcsC family protein [Nocardioides sp.]
MSARGRTVVVVDGESLTTVMSEYERRRWAELNAHWDTSRRDRLPPRARRALAAVGEKGQELASTAGRQVTEATPSTLKRIGGLAADAALVPTVKAVTKLLEFTAEVVTELSKPDKVLKHHRSNGHDVESVSDLRQLDLKELDDFTRRMSLSWRAIGAVEGGALGALAFVPGPGTFAAISLDVIVSHALTAAIATRVAYAYGFDATDPDQQQLIERMVRRAYKDIAPKTGAMQKSAKAFKAGQGRVRWSQKLRTDEKLLAAVEKLMTRFGGSPVPVQKAVAKLPAIAIVTSAGLNQHMLADVAKQARIYAATVFLAEKYDLPLPSQLKPSLEDIPLHLDAEGDETPLR